MKKTKKQYEEPVIIPCGIFTSRPYITINDFKLAELDGCSEIITYEDNIVRIRCHGGIISIYGTALQMKSFFGSQISICGVICGVEFKREDDGEELDG